MVEPVKRERSSSLVQLSPSPSLKRHRVAGIKTIIFDPDGDLLLHFIPDGYQLQPLA